MSSYEKVGRICEELREIAAKYDITIWFEHQFVPVRPVGRIERPIPQGPIFIDYISYIKTP